MTTKTLGTVATMILIAILATGCIGGGGSTLPNGTNSTYGISGRAIDTAGKGIPDVTIVLSGGTSSKTSTDCDGKWSAIAEGQVVVTPLRDGWQFEPSQVTVSGARSATDFTGEIKEFKVIRVAPADGSTEIDPALPAMVVEFNNTLGISAPQATKVVIIEPHWLYSGWIVDENAIRISPNTVHLLPYGQTYQITININVWDVYGNRPKEDYRFSFTVRDDIWPPDKTTLGISCVGNSAELIWEKTYDNPRATAVEFASTYRVYRADGVADHKVITTVRHPDTSFTDVNLPPGKYSYYITALDSAGNESAPSNTVTVTVI